jgi:hypothetical protein
VRLRWVRPTEPDQLRRLFDRWRLAWGDVWRSRASRMVMSPPSDSNARNDRSLIISALQAARTSTIPPRHAPVAAAAAAAQAAPPPPPPSAEELKLWAGRKEQLDEMLQEPNRPAPTLAAQAFAPLTGGACATRTFARGVPYILASGKTKDQVARESAARVLGLCFQQPERARPRHRPPRAAGATRPVHLAGDHHAQRRRVRRRPRRGRGSRGGRVGRQGRGRARAGGASARGRRAARARRRQCTIHVCIIVSLPVRTCQQSTGDVESGGATWRWALSGAVPLSTRSEKMQKIPVAWQIPCIAPRRL